jgi:hypothetical protein
MKAGIGDHAIVSPGLAKPAAVTEKQCNDCHILSRAFESGDREEPGWVRSQGAGWKWSRCNTESGGNFGCVTCHDPHKGMKETTTEYEAKCLACHSAANEPHAGWPKLSVGGSGEARRSVCSVDAATGCIKCHMPGVRMNTSHRDLTDHYIRIVRPRGGEDSQGKSRAGAKFEGGRTG